MCSSFWVFDTKDNIQVSIDEYGSLALYNETTGQQTLSQEIIQFLIGVLNILNKHMYYAKEE